MLVDVVIVRVLLLPAFVLAPSFLLTVIVLGILLVVPFRFFAVSLLLLIVNAAKVFDFLVLLLEVCSVREGCSVVPSRAAILSH